ncbi:serine hydrolase domain-containing protein [Luteibacter aegosomatissinici]|uniref:serine hydrolase domain-containing protein n=1 Tax=Luteibacter aegosomatissinici TaxID=2911539 RepID=UPI001FF86327|nr:serine hydrolase domain-containing protein [Luteibacter aegosomatissinici]UPG95727.1 beta-lactamase family protein [Luteibacter aegosomatissinici]
MAFSPLAALAAHDAVICFHLDWPGVIPRESPRMPIRPLGRTALIAALACAVADIAAAATVPTDNPRITAMDNAVDAAAASFFSSRCHAGLSIAVVTKDGSHVYNYGVANRETGTLPRADSVYEIASVTKSFTATLAAYAVHSGKMSLDGDFRGYLASPYPNLARDGHPITLATLLTHRSGMPRDIPDTDAVFAAKNPRTLPAALIQLAQGQDERTFLSALRKMPLRSTPGTAEQYSNAGFLLIGAGLEHVYGMPYETLLRKRILEPLGMASTTLTLAPALKAREVTGYDMFGQPTPDHPANAGAAWGLWSTPEDLARYVRWQLDSANPVVTLSHRALVHGADEDVAMAWHLEQAKGEPVVSHGGGSFGTSSQVVLFPRSGQGFALLANDTCKGTEGALKTLAIDAHSGAAP